MYYVVTGAAGFIGSNLVKALNERGETNIIAVDNLKRADKFKNLTDCDIADYMDKQEFIDHLRDGYFDGLVTAVLHEGACLADGLPEAVRANPRVQEVYLGEGEDDAALH